MVPNLGHHHIRKSKHDSKRNRKPEPANERDLLKSLKLERKLETKLEKLERKTLKLKEKSLAVAARSSDSDVGRGRGTIGLTREDVEMRFDAKPAKNPVAVIPHMAGGETYLQQWEVINNGNLRWDAETDLRFAWGHEALIPISKVVQCPKLKPGEQGMVSVLLDVPSAPGQYESYWHFHHGGRRFGHWLGCQIIVDPSPRQSVNFLKPTYRPSAPVQDDFPNPFEDHFGCQKVKKEVAPDSPKPLNTEELVEDTKTFELDGSDDNDLSQKEVKIPADDTNCSSDSDNQSIISIADTNTSLCSASTEEFVVVPNAEPADAPQDVEVETEKNDDNNNSSASLEVGAEAAKKLEEPVKKSGYAYVTIDGKKFAVPKCFLHDEYLATAEDAPDPNQQQPEPKSTGAIPKTTEPKLEQKTPEQIAEEITTIFSKSIAETKPTFSYDFGKPAQSCVSADNQSNDSHCSAAGTATPGFEIVHVASDANQAAAVEERKKPEAANVAIIDIAPERDGVGQFLVSTASSSDSYCPTMVGVPQDLGMTYSWARPSQNLAISYAEMYDHSNSYGPVADPNPYGPLDASSDYACAYPVYAGIPQSHPTPPIYPYLPVPASSELPRKPVPQRAETAKPEAKVTPVLAPQVHAIPENLMAGAVNVASSAISTARSVLNMIVPAKAEEPGKWVNGHWVTMKPESSREAALNLLAEMGFTNRDYNASLLNRYEDDIEKVIADLLATK